jgi:hypothetical protein
LSLDTQVSYDGGGFADSIALADLNLDGKLDLAVSSETERSLNVLYGNDDGTFAMRWGDNLEDGQSGVGVADLNGDGIQDLFVQGAGTLKVLLSVCK